MFWFALALLVVSFIIRTVFAPKPQDAKPAALKDFDFPQVEEGTPQPVIFGEVWTTDWMVLGVGNYRSRAITSSGGGKK